MLLVCVMQMVIDMDGCEKLIARNNASFVLCRFWIHDVLACVHACARVCVWERDRERECV